MPGDQLPDAPPPELPEEFAAAYREAYRRALEDEVTERPAPPPPPVVLPQEVAVTGSDRTGSDPAVEPAPGGAFARWRGSPWFLPSAVIAGGLVLVAAAYGLGAVIGNDDRSGAPAGSSPHVARTSGPARSQSASPTEPTPSSAPGGWSGPVSPVTIDAISADCTAPPGTDSAGHPVSYVPENAIDDKAHTAWRCPGTAVGQILTLRLARDADIAEVGLVPGYAKTDPVSRIDRYAENNRIIRVRWTLADGVTVVQRLDPDRTSRAVQLLRVPRTRTRTITLEVLAVQRGPRDTTAISDIALAAAEPS